MKVGKVPENVLKRSVMKQLHFTRDEVVLGPGIGEDCAAIALEPDEILVMSTDPITGTTKDIGKLAIQITANDLASSGAEPIGVMLTILLPDGTREIALKRIMEQMEEACGDAHIQIMGGHTEVTKVVNQPVVSVTGVAKAKKGQLVTTAGAKPGMDIVLTKWIGIEGTTILAKEREAELKEYFPPAFVDVAISFEQYVSVVPEAAVATKSGVSAMHDVTEGGIYGALWEMAERAGVGLEVDLKKIPVKQETVEICEFFDVNPYNLYSAGALLAGSWQPEVLVSKLHEQGIPAAVIGYVTDKNDRIIRNGEDVRFLDRPQQEEWYRKFGG